MYNKILFRFTFFTALCTSILIFIGGLVTSTGSGLSVPDWPTTFGENMFTYPIHKWTGGVEYEHGHRLFASFVGFLTVVSVVLIQKFEQRKWVKVLSYYALFLVILQGTLGGLTVLLKLPPAVSIAHGMIAQSFFCLISSLALFTSKWWYSVPNINLDKKDTLLFKLSIAMVVVVFIQLFFGALLRHTYSGLAIPDFPAHYGTLFPSLSQESIAQYNQQLISLGIKHPADRPVMAYQIVIHIIHRLWAYAVGIFLLYAGRKMYKNVLLPVQIQVSGLIISTLVLLQIVLGIFIVITSRSVIVTTAHVFIGAVLLMTSVVLMLQLWRIKN
jgi:cytochrome c oxidase assembly protein subunit 15